MNREDYDVWESHFCKTFPEMATWLGKQDQETREAWRDALDDVPLADAMEATKLIHRGEGQQPLGPSKYPAAIRASWHDIRETRAAVVKPTTFGRWKDGEETYTCPLCHDTYAPDVVVLQPRAVRQAMAGVPWGEIQTPTGRRGVGTFSVACSCFRGQQHAEKSKREMYVYDPLKMFKVPDGWGLAKEPEGFADWLEQYKVMRTKRLPNYETAFDAFK